MSQSDKNGRVRGAAVPWRRSRLPSSSRPPESWTSLHENVRAQIAAALGTPMSVTPVGHGSNAFNGRVATASGDYFVKVPSDYSRRGSELIEIQVQDEGALPASFPKPESAGHGSCQVGERRISWLAHKWMSGHDAATAFAQGTHPVTPRLVNLCRRATIPSRDVTEGAHLSFVGIGLRQRYTGWWRIIEKQPELLQAYPFKPKLRAQLLDHRSEFAEMDNILVPALVDTHVVHLDANIENAFFSDAGSSHDVLVDGQYGFGPPWLTSFQLFHHAFRLGHISESYFDHVLSKFGMSRELVNAYVAAFVGYRCAQLAELTPPEPDIVPIPIDLAKQATWLIERVKGRTVAKQDATPSSMVHLDAPASTKSDPGPVPKSAADPPPKL